jgi:hypothetical protein
VELRRLVALLADRADLRAGLVVNGVQLGGGEPEREREVIVTDDAQRRPPDREVGIASTRSGDGERGRDDQRDHWRLSRM